MTQSLQSDGRAVFFEEHHNNRGNVTGAYG